MDEGVVIPLLRQITLGSLFDGIGGWPLAAIRAGIRPVWASEIEKFPQAVTKTRFPDMVQLGDITKIDGAKIEPVDIICMGSPCQDLSIAGKQEGLKGARSGLFHQAIELVRRMRSATGGRYPRFVVWENVPGAFISNRGHDFKAVLEAIAQTEVPIPGSGKWAPAGMVRSQECDLAWRALDAQYWGVPQRRKRIFLIADFGSERRCANKILFECESLSGDSAEGRETGERSAAGTAGSPEASSLDYRGRAVGFNGYNNALTGDRAATLGINCGVSTGRNGVLCLNDQGGKQMNVTRDIIGALRAEAHHPPLIIAKRSHDSDAGKGDARQMVVGFSVGASAADSNPVLDDLAPTMRATTRLGCMCAGFKASQGSKAQGIGYQEETAPTLSAMDSGNKPAVLLYENHGTDTRIKGPMDTSPTITARAGTGGNNLPLVTCIGNGQMHQIQPSDKTGALNCMHDQQCVVVPSPQKTIVRRLTPLECERLQGLPDGWTLIDDKSCSDSARYKALGNGMAQPCADFIIRRIAESMRREGDYGNSEADY